MPVSSKKGAGLLQPGAGIAVALPGVIRSFRAFAAYVGDSCLQGVDKFLDRRVRRGLQLILAQPAASAAKQAIRTTPVVVVKAALQVAIGEIDLAIDKPSRVREQRRGIPGNRAGRSASRGYHESSGIGLSGSLDRTLTGGLSGLLPT